MDLTVLGSSGTYPGPGKPASGYLVRSSSGTTLWVDCGPGTFLRLLELMPPSAVDGIVISHTHVDHCSDLFAYYHHQAYSGADYRRIPTYVPYDAMAHLGAFARASGDHQFHHVFHFHTVGDGDAAVVGDIELRFANAHHTVPALVTRFDADGDSLVYSGDTGTCDGLTMLAGSVDLLLCEATMQGSAADLMVPFHLTAGQAGAVAAEAGVKRLMLTHIPPHLDVSRSVAEAGAEYAGPIDVAAPGSVVAIGAGSL